MTPTTMVAVRGDATYGGTTATLTATLTLPGGVPLAGATVHFTFNGASAGDATTDASGVATLTVPLGAKAAGSYKDAVGASYAGDTYHQASSATGKLVVAKALL